MILGSIDYSMSCPCVTLFRDTIAKFSFKNCESHYLIDNKRYEGKFENITGHLYSPPDNQIERFIHIGTWAVNLIKDCDAILIEDYSFGSNGRVFHVAENTAILKYFMHMNKLKWTALPPTSLKKFATGKGNADKQKMYDIFLEETKVDLRKIFDYKGKNIGNPISDIVDSFYLLKYLTINNNNTPE